VSAVQLSLKPKKQGRTTKTGRLNPRRERNLKIRGLVPLSFLILLVVWGYSWVLLKLALHDCGPITFAALRTFFAALVLLAMLPLLGRPFLPTRLAETLLLGVVQTTLFVTLSQLSLVEGGAGRSSVLVFTMPFWTLLFASIALGERLLGGQRWAIAAAALGLFAILEPWQSGGSLISKMIAVSAGATWAAATVIAKRIQTRAPIDLVSLTAWQMLFGSLILIVFAWVAGEPPTHWTPRFVAILVFTAVISTALCWFVWLSLLRRLSAGVASMGMLAIPVFATAASAYQLGERLNWNEYTGMGLIVLALLALSAAAMRQQRRFNTS
jgi:drug/metabolite transporter (DMT)-like permease